MHQIPETDVRQWASQGGGSFPASFSLSCPFCSDVGVFTTSNHQSNNVTKTAVSTARCPACNESVTTITALQPDNAALQSRGVFVLPAPIARNPISESNVTDSPAVDRAYQSAVRAFNVGLWDACMTSCRKTLEGIVQTQGNSTGRTLFQQLEDFFNQQDLAQPLVHLTHTLRQGGNIGAHFDLDREPDQHVARMMLDLIEYFLEFVYILPNQSSELERRINEFNSPPETATEASGE